MTVRIRPDGLYEIIHPEEASEIYGFDWNAEVFPENIISSSWTITPAITLTNQTNNSDVTSVTVSGATNGKLYKLTNVISTPTRTTSKSMILVCQPKGAY